MNSARNLIERIDRFIEQHGQNPTGFGRNAVNDPNFVRDLKDGRSVGIKTIDRVLAYMAGEEAKREGCRG